MPQAKKFGAFAGVFTPSLLTILGVIMYMRLGWVVGQAGLVSTLTIILIAHIISVTTGLSISSVATDKKIRAGGIYYILSRSLGLPMGGAIGIALFIGTALSISLYLVGFAESFLGIESIRNFLGLEQNDMGYRIIGSASIVVLVVVAFISTSLAIKTQFYILGFIALSLVSIGVGLFTGGNADAGGVILSKAPEALPIEVIFAIFFPAVTGFTAGVAMSGDLANPKKAIPRGTLASIGTGLIVYLGLAIGFAFFVDRQLLLSDYNFLLKIAWISPLVIAGIWGATLSSALGGILGGPRILQATSADKITPRIFAKTYGKNNEPRNALIFIFLIAEAGILIGELNVIAGIVSMFYLASYGFINLAFFLESWASTDFRPSFRVNRYIGLIGFIAAFGVMFKLDMVSMFAALIIMWGLFFFLKRKNLRTGYGDVWQSVYSSVVKNALYKMDRQDEEERNWKPNIILFSGGTKKRPHLIEFGKYIIGKHGVLSNFDLIENKSATVLFPKRKQSIIDENDDPGIFTRKKTVRDIYEGIETISAIYGFSGFEPNTVLLGWARQSRNPGRFVQSLNTLNGLDLNVLVLDYDKNAGFGKYQTIDIWWKDVSNQGNLALSLAKLILLSGTWQNATVRLMIANSRNDQNEKIHRKAEQLLENIRFNANIKVINNEIEKKSLYDLMYAESGSSDLVIVGLPEIIAGEEEEFVKSTNKLLHKIGTVLMIRASSTFKKLKLGSETPQFTSIEKDSDLAIATDPVFMNKENFPEQEELAIEIKNQLSAFSRILNEFQSGYMEPAMDFHRHVNLTIDHMVTDIFSTFQSQSFRKAQQEQRLRIISALKINFLIKAARIPEDMYKTTIREQTETIRNGINYLINRIGNTADLVPASINVTYFGKDLEKNMADHPRSRLFKSWKRTIHSSKKKKRGINYHFRLRKLVRSEIPINVYNNLLKSLDKYGRLQVESVIEFQKLIDIVNRSFTLFELQPEVQFSDVRMKEEKEKITAALRKFTSFSSVSSGILIASLMEALSRATDEMNGIASKIPANYFMNEYPAHKVRSLISQLEKAPVFLAEKLILLHNAAHVDIRIAQIKYRVNKTIAESLSEIETVVQENVVMKAEKTIAKLEEYVESLESGKKTGEQIPAFEMQLPGRHELQLSIDKITDKAFRNIKTVINKLPRTSEFLSTESFNTITNTLFEETETVKLSTLQLVDYYIQGNLLEPMIDGTGKLAGQVLDSMENVRDTIRRISFGNKRNDLVSEEQDFIYDDNTYLEFVREQKETAKAETKAVDAIVDDLRVKLLKDMQSTLDDLTIYKLLKTPEKYRRYLRKTGKVKKTIPQRLKSVNENIKRKSAQLWHRKSDAILFARKVAESGNKSGSTVNALLNIREKTSPSKMVVDKLPFYYQQLFLRKFNYQNEFWFNREKEIQETVKAINRHSSGFSGAILVRGEQNSGKTFFVNYIASAQFNNQNTYYIQVPTGGSTEVNTFTNALQEATGIFEPYLNIFTRLHENSLIIIDNLELWWEKTENGLEVIKCLADILQKFGNRQLFMITVNTQSFEVINQMIEINRYFLNIIDLEPMNSKQLQDVILFRHRTSGFTMKMKNKQSGIFHVSETARLFSRYFNYTGGNIGIALLTWVANITGVNGKEIEIKSPEMPDLTILKELPPVIRLYLMQFIFHKRLSFEKLQRVTLDNEETVEKNIRFMKRAGLVVETAGHVYEIDKYMFVHINRILFGGDASQQLK